MELQFTKELKQAWVEDLKSGEYVQAFNTFIDSDNSHCCIAVLGAVIDKNPGNQISNCWSLLESIEGDERIR